MTNYAGNKGLEYYKDYPRDFFEGTVGMRGDLRGFYGMVIKLIYMHDGYLLDDWGHIAGLTGYGKAKSRNMMNELISLGKIIAVKNENTTLFTQKRAENELKTSRKFQEKQKNNVSERWKNNDLGRDVVIPPQDHKTTRQKTTTKVVSKKTGKRLSEDWILPKDWGQWAVDQGWAESAIRLEAEKFKDFWISKAGKDAAKRDWLATWRNWMRNSKTQKGTINGKSSGADIAQRAAERWAARGVDSGEGASSSQPLLSAGQPDRRSGSSD